MSFNLADCFDLIASTCPDREALIQATQRHTWQALERRARNLSAWMKARGATHQGKVAIYTYNHPAYMEGVYAAMKAALVPVNVNYRYREEELRYLLDNADAEIVVVHEDFVPMLAAVAAAPAADARRAGGRRRRGRAVHSRAAVMPRRTKRSRRPIARRRRSRALPTIILFLYTGGTTGMPKGVMWRQDDLYHRLAGGGLMPAPTSLDGLREFVAQPADAACARSSVRRSCTAPAGSPR